jgi:hypothetical protein
MQFKWRKWNRAIHRDFGYFFFGMVVIYCLSGIAINHRNDWNPNYIITAWEFQVNVSKDFNKESIKSLIKEYDIESTYLNHYNPGKEELRVFLKDGSLSINLKTGYGLLELSKRRPLFKAMNYLHYNPVKYWTWYSDIFSGALIIIGLSGLFILKGKKGITHRGAWLTIFGIVLPLIFLILFYY